MTAPGCRCKAERRVKTESLLGGMGVWTAAGVPRKGKGQSEGKKFAKWQLEASWV
jgi:hypothetical protein